MAWLSEYFYDQEFWFLKTINWLFLAENIVVYIVKKLNVQ